jgi:hypothetical protein
MARLVKRARRRLRLGSRLGTEAVTIDGLISPLRYDVLVRQQFFEFFRENEEMGRHDKAQFQAAALHEPYFVWFRDIVIGRRWRLLKGQTVEEAYAEQVTKAISLYDSFNESDPIGSKPIVVRRVTEPTRTGTGKIIANRCLLVDGGHRVALLRLNGITELPARAWLEVHDRWMPRDNTHRLLESLDVSDEEYYSFLSLGMTKERQTSAHDLLEAVTREAPERLEELRSIIVSDTPMLRSSR